MNIDPETGEFVGYTFHPNGDRIKIIDCGTTEPDTNAFVSDWGYPCFEYDATGEVVKWDELNKIIEVDGDKTHLHEWLYSSAKWQ